MFFNFKDLYKKNKRMLSVCALFKPKLPCRMDHFGKVLAANKYEQEYVNYNI